jgi:prepilin-type N-terminal cleavage/methylation domain-containing protein
VRSTLRRLWRDEGGFTLPEMLVTMMLMVIVMFALYSIFDMGLRVFSFGNDKTEAVENARLGLGRMERELRAAYPYDKAAGNETLFSSYGAQQVTFGNDANGDRTVTTDEQIAYTLSGATLMRNGQPMVEFVDGLTFEFLDENGNPVASEPDIDMVRVTLDIEVQRGPKAGTQTLNTNVALRNRTDQRQ